MQADKSSKPGVLGSNELLGVVRWGGKEHRAQWRLVAENADTALDPCEVRYRVCLIDAKGRIIERDALVTEAEHGVWKRISQACKLPVLKPRPKPHRRQADFVVDA